MKAIKYLSMLLVMVAMNVCMVSCGSDDDPIEQIEEATGITGTWMTTESGGSRTYQFGKEGTGSMVQVIIDKDGNSETTSLNFKYTNSETSAGKGNLQVHVAGSGYVYTWPYTLTGNTLMITDSNGVWVLTRR